MKKLFAMSVILLIFNGCQKRYEIENLNDFSIDIPKLTYKVGEPIIFQIKGQPDYLVFWSGESGKKYENRNRTNIQGNKIDLIFKSFAQFGPRPVDQSTLKLLVSTDFTGIYDQASVESSTWEDITNRAIISTGTDNTESGVVDISEFAERNKNMAIAFHYKTAEIKPYSAQNRWVIRSFDIISTDTEGTTTSIANMANAGWSALNFSGTSTNWTISPSQIFSAINSSELDNDWAITKLMNPNQVSPDKGEPIKNMSQNINQFTKTYNKPGIYKVVFVATNGNFKESLTSIKELELTITSP